MARPQCDTPLCYSYCKNLALILSVFGGMPTKCKKPHAFQKIRCMHLQAFHFKKCLASFFFPWYPLGKTGKKNKKNKFKISDFILCHVIIPEAIGIAGIGPLDLSQALIPVMPATLGRYPAHTCPHFSGGIQELLTESFFFST
jgi:hypothetical protein